MKGSADRTMLASGHDHGRRLAPGDKSIGEEQHRVAEHDVVHRRLPRSVTSTEVTAAAARSPLTQTRMRSPAFNSPAARSLPSARDSGCVAVVISVLPSILTSTSRFFVTNIAATLHRPCLPSGPIVVTMWPERRSSIALVPPGTSIGVPAGKQPGWHGGGGGLRSGAGPCRTTSVRSFPSLVAHRNRA